MTSDSAVSSPVTRAQHSGRHANNLTLFPLLLTIVLLVLAFFLASQQQGITPTKPDFAVPFVISLIALASLFVFPDYPGISPSKIYGSVLWAFNFGLVSQWVLGIPLSARWEGRLRWLSDAEVALAAVYVMSIAMVAFAVGVQLGRVAFANRSAVARTTTDQYETNRGIALVGAGAMYLALAGWLYLTVSALGFRFFLVSYEEFLAATESTPMGIPLTLLIGASALLGASYRDPRSRTAFRVFLVWAVVAFLIGLRGEALFPLLTYAAARTLWEPVRVRLKVVVFVIIGAMAGVAATWIRSTGLGDLDWERLDLNPLLAIAEMGVSSFVTYFIYGFHEQGYPLVGLSQLFLPFAVIARRFGLAEGFPYEDVSLNYLVTNSFTGSGRGGSVTAEAYHGFGYLGVVVILGLIGVWLAASTTFNKTPVSVTWVAFISGTLFAGVRNSSENFFVYVAVMLLLMVAVLVVNATSSRNSTPHGTPLKRISL